MDDPHRKPGNRDRDPLVARIKRAADQGRIGAADRDIRLGNVASAQSIAELDLIVRDLDQLEATLSPTSAADSAAASAADSSAAPAWTGSSTLPVAEQLADQTVQAVKTTARSLGVVTALILALVLAGGGALAFFSSYSSSSSGGELFEPEPVPADTGEPVDEPTGEPTGGPSTSASAYALTGPGIRAFLTGYRATFSTSLVVELTMYDDYVVVQVPQAGARRRHAGFLYRPADGWTPSGGVTADFPGTRPVDVGTLDVPALVRNIARARRTLNVENPTTTYVNIDYRPDFDPAPNVNVYVSNEFHESGYLATTLDGTVERAYPFAQ